MEVVGKRKNRIEGVDKVTGDAKFTGDLKIPGLLEARVLRSTYPHARIRSIDVSLALEIPGVVAVLTGGDLGDIDPYYGHCLQDRPIVALDHVRHVGEPVAAVAAENGLAAEMAVAAIVVSLESGVPGVRATRVAPRARATEDR